MSTRAGGLTELEKRILELEGEGIQLRGTKVTAIRDRFADMSEVRYYALLNRLIDKQAALEHDAVLVNRLRRIRTLARNRRNVWGV